MERAGTWRLRAAVLGVGLALVAGRAAADDPPAAKPAAGDDLKAELLKLNQATGKDGPRQALVALVRDKAKAKRAVALGQKLQQAAGGKDKPFNFTGAYVLGRAAHYLKDYPAAEFFLKDALDAASRTENGPKLVQAYQGLLDLLYDQKKFAEVVDLAEKFVDLRGPDEVDRFKPFALERMIQAKARMGKADEALKAAEGLVQLDDGGWYFVRLKGYVLREAGKYDEAVEAYLESLDKLDAAKQLDPELRDGQKDLTRYILSGLYVDAGDVDKAARQLQALIKKEPDNPTYKNDLGFIWADHDKNLDESEKLIREALELDKKRKEKAKPEDGVEDPGESAAYVDSLGWVLFKKKKYDEALPYLKKAAADEDEGNHLEIWDHVGDCLAALGKKDEALAAWQKGLTMEDIGRRDVERRKKVEAKVKAAGAEPKKPAGPKAGSKAGGD